MTSYEKYGLRRMKTYSDITGESLRDKPKAVIKPSVNFHFYDNLKKKQPSPLPPIEPLGAEPPISIGVVPPACGALTSTYLDNLSDLGKLGI